MISFINKVTVTKETEATDSTQAKTFCAALSDSVQISPKQCPLDVTKCLRSFMAAWKKCIIYKEMVKPGLSLPFQKQT